MDETQYPVKIHCPISQVEEYVFFNTVEINNEIFINLKTFNGCDHNYHACDECKRCEAKAIEIVKEQTK